MRPRWLFFGLVAALFVWLLASGLPDRALLALRIMDELREPGPRSWLQRATPPPRVHSTTLAARGVRFAADVYEPGGGHRQPLLLVPGMVPEGKGDPRVPPFAAAMARAGFLVVVPDLPSFQSLVVQPANVRELAAAIEAVAERRDLAPDGRTGVFGVSFAGGIAMLAALDSTVARRISFLVTMGAYADLDSVLTFLATGRTFVRGRAHAVEPDPYSQLVFVRTYEQFLPRARDRELLEAMARRRFDDPRAPLGDLADSLSPEGRLPYDLFAAARPTPVSALLGRLPAELERRMAALSPERHDLSGLRVPLFLAHAWDDGTVPVGETWRLARRARAHTRVHSILLHTVGHVEAEPWHRHLRRFLSEDLPEVWRLEGWLTSLLGRRGCS
jgi:pimeloyl-ACP methyl ester carboxylesterase